MTECLTGAAVAVLNTADADCKALRARALAQAWRTGAIRSIGAVLPPERPARPSEPVLTRPGDMPRRRLGGIAGRRALMHAVAHIELNAIDLAFDLIARFADQGLPDQFYDDWVAVGDDEARHFQMLQKRLGELDTAYGALPAHDGLWQAAADTAHDLAARLAVVPMILEARGLDVTPGMIEKLKRVDDHASAALLAVILEEEIIHVAAGTRWFEWTARRCGADPPGLWRQLVGRHFKGRIKPPFNHGARERAAMSRQYYAPDEN